MDFNLNGLIMGMNLLTKPEEIYLSLIEATAYGTRMIIEQFEDAGVPVNALVLSGGIPAKNKMLVQIYSDVCNKEIRISGTDQASALVLPSLVSLLLQNALLNLKMQMKPQKNLERFAMRFINQTQIM